MNTQIQLITKPELDDWCSRPFNAPSISTPDDETAFFEEYWACHASIKSALETIGRHDYLGEGDFGTNDDACLSRVVSIELTYTGMMSPEFVNVAQRALSELPAEYELWVTHECLDVELFFLLVFRDSVRGFFRNPADASRFQTHEARALES